MNSPLPSLTELSRSIQAGELTPAGLVADCLERITERDNSVRAWAYVAQQEARREAERLTEELRTRGPRSPLHGIPFGVKDIFDTAGMPTRWGSPLYADRVSSGDAELIQMLKRAGAIVLGKTHTTAFAYYDAAPTCNPVNLAHTPGGSSSGSAAAVAAGMAPFAIGSQTQGSVLRPASFCGVVGFKPTFGRLPLGGVLPFAESLDHAGFFTRTVEEMAFLWSALWDSVPATDAARRLAAVPWPPDGGVEPEMKEAVAACCERLAAGFAVDAIDLPASFLELPGTVRTVNKFEGARFHRERFEKYGDRIGSKLAALVEEGLAIPGSVYQSAKETIEKARAEYAAASGEHPVWITPAAPGPAPRGLDSTGDPRCNLPFTGLGAPAVTLPFALSAQGLPLGLQLTAAPGQEAVVLTTALECERVLAEEAAARGHSTPAPHQETT